MEKVSTKLILACLATMSAFSCAAPNKTNGTIQTQDATKEHNDSQMDDNYLILSDKQLETIEQGNTFALNLFRTQIGNESNVVSPISAAFLMGMLANGASGDTQSEILKTLMPHSTQTSPSDMNEAYMALTKLAMTNDRQVNLSIANLIAVNKQVSIKQPYIMEMENMYDAKIEKLDFASNKSTERINNWCSRKTDGMIHKIIDKLSPSDIAVLANAIFFNSTWKNKFDKRNTKEENFKGYTRDIKRVPMMHQNTKLMYMESSKFSAVELPYGNGKFSMTILLPNSGVSIKEMMSETTAKDLSRISNEMTTCYVDLKMPRFTTTTDIKLNKPIAELGAPSMFIPSKARFGNISDGSFHVSSMIQKAKIEVSEEGTKAAAVTAAIMTMSALSPEEPRHVKFHANRPFTYVITEKTTGAIFFIGQFTGSEQ